MIKIKPTRNKQFRVYYTADNGEVLAVSEPLKTKASCRKNIKAMQKNYSQVDNKAFVDGVWKEL